MQQKNFEYLKNQVKYAGFGEQLDTALQEKLQTGAPEFQLTLQGKYGADETVATLYFRKSDQSELYFFNKYELSLKNKFLPETIQQSFRMGKENNFTLKEAYNLLNGRAVNKDLTGKEGQSFNAWVQLDFNELDSYGNHKFRYFHQNYGFDLARELEKYPLRELASEEEKARLMASLKKGNRQAVTFLKTDGAQPGFVEANPRYKSLVLYNGNLQRLSNRQTMAEKQAAALQPQETTQAATAVATKQKDLKADNTDAPAQKKKRKKKSQTIT